MTKIIYIIQKFNILLFILSNDFRLFTIFNIPILSKKYLSNISKNSKSFSFSLIDIKVLAFLLRHLILNLLSSFITIDNKKIIE